MVRVHEIELEKAIKITKMRIKHHEKHGVGDVVIHEKSVLKKQERKKELRRQNR